MGKLVSVDYPPTWETSCTIGEHVGVAEKRAKLTTKKILCVKK